MYKDFQEFLEAKKTKTACCGGQKTPKEEWPNGTAQPQSKDGKKVSRSQEKGLGEEGDKELVYDPVKKSKPGKIPTAEALSAVRTIRDAMINNPRFVEYLVSELNRSGLTGCLVGELVGYQETYANLAQVMGNENYGRRVCDRLARALKEDVAPPFGAKPQMGNMNVPAPDDDPNTDPSLDPNFDPNTDPNADPNDPNAMDMPPEDEEGLDDDPNADAPNPFEDDEDQEPNPFLSQKNKMGPPPPQAGPMPPISPAMENFQRSMNKRFI